MFWVDTAFVITAMVEDLSHRDGSLEQSVRDAVSVILLARVGERTIPILIRRPVPLPATIREDTPSDMLEPFQLRSH